MATAERAGVLLTDSMTPVQRAIAIVEDSRRTHCDWEKYLASMPDHFPDTDIVGDARWHAECVQNYDEVLALLRSLPASLFGSSTREAGE